VAAVLLDTAAAAMQLGARAGSDQTSSGTLSTTTESMDFPQFPGEDFLAHTATQYLEAAEARFAKLKLLAVAEGHDPPAVKAIIDVDLDSIPELPQSHRDYHRRME